MPLNISSSSYQTAKKECDSDTFGAIAGGVAEEFYGGFGDIDGDGIIRRCLDLRLQRLLGEMKIMIRIKQ